MIIANKELLDDYVQRHANALKPLNKWIEDVSAAQWKNVNITTITKGHTSTNKALFAATIHYSAPGFVTFRCTARTAVAQKVEWNAVAGAAGYQVQISNAAGTKWAKYYNTAGTSFVFKN